MDTISRPEGAAQDAAETALTEPAGWALVPLEPTPEMLSFALGPRGSLWWDQHRMAWHALLAAAERYGRAVRGELHRFATFDNATCDSRTGRRLVPVQHTLKSWPTNFQAVSDGVKRHEVRVVDRDFRFGDRIMLREWEPETRQYTGRTWQGYIGHITASRTFGMPEGTCSFTLLEEPPR